MGFINNLKQIATGKTDIERKQERTANMQLRKDVNAAIFKTRKEEAIKFAVTKEQLKYSNATKKLKSPKQSVSNFGIVAPEYKNYGSVTGQPRVYKGKKYGRKSKKRGLDILGI